MIFVSREGLCSDKDIIKSPIVSHLVQEGKLKIVAAEYQLKSGKVQTIELAQASAPAKHHKH